MGTAGTVTALATAIALIVGLWVVTSVHGTIELPYDVLKTTNETIYSSGSVPEVIQVSNVYDGLLENRETIIVVDSATGTETLLTRDVDYTVLSLTDGTFNITNAPGVNDTTDYYKITYEAKNYIQSAENALSNVSSNIYNAMNLLAVAVIVAAATLILMYFRR